MLPITLAGESVRLLPQKALFWAGALLVADPHLGKPDTFLAAGVAVPPDTTAADLARLAGLIAGTGATRLVVLGDLFHARRGRSAAMLGAVGEWRERHAGLDVLVVRGNHDRHAGDPPPAWGFRCVEEPWVEGPFAFRHFPEPTAGAYTLAGHVHPAVTLRGKGRQRLTLPCFFLDAAVGILPAFGGFTGTGTLRPGPGTRVFVIADGEVVPAGV